MPTLDTTRARRGILVTAISILSLMALANPAGAVTAHWVPADAAIDDLSGLDSHYAGLAGRLVVGEAVLAPELSVRGATPVEVDFNGLYVYLVEDASIAEFASPARVLLVCGEHELLVQTDGEAPRLTMEAERTLHGFSQAVRLSPNPLVAAAPAVSGPAQGRDYDPLIQTMVDELTEASCMAQWQPLEDFVTRYYSASQNNLATQWVLDQFLSYGLDAEFHYYTHGGTRRQPIATLPGLVAPDSVVYITSHVDATSPTPFVCAPGAGDNASGTGAVLEAARILSQYQFRYTIKFAPFNSEEQGLIGSAAYVAEIAAANEIVIGCFNGDGISHRGVDPAPPDLVIYTNAASVPLANTLADACDNYLPGQLEPLVTVEASPWSDHASFWNHGYRAVWAIEDELWGDDFGPWYHTCNDLIANYPTDYITWVSKAMLAAVATTAVPLGSADVVAGLPQAGRPALSVESPALGEVLIQHATVGGYGELAIYDISGRLVADLSKAGLQSSRHVTRWNGQDAGGRPVAPGLYFVRLRSGDREERRKVVLLR